MLKRFFRDQRGATAIEYGLIIAVLSLAIIGALGRSANQISNNFNYVSGLLSNSMQE